MVLRASGALRFLRLRLRGSGRRLLLPARRLCAVLRLPVLRLLLGLLRGLALLLAPPAPSARAATWLFWGGQVLGQCVGNLRQRSELLAGGIDRSEEHTSELQSHVNIVCRLL